MADISPILQWVNEHPNLAGLATFIISAAESVAIIGTIVPGTIMMTGIGALAGAGVIPLWSTIILAILGAIVGDGISYWLGYYFKDRLHIIWPFRTYPTLLSSGESFFRKYGGMSVFIGRFVGPVRALVPLVAGMLGMRPLRFAIANILSAIGWAPAYMLPGILLGALSLEVPPDVATHAILGLLFLFLFIILCIYTIYQLFKLVRHQTNQFLNWIWQGLLRSKYFHVTTVILKHHNVHKTYGQLTLAFYFCCVILAFIALSFYVQINGATNIFINTSLYHLFRSLRTPDVDQVMLHITLLGQKQILLAVAAAVVAWLAWTKRWRVAFHAFMLIALTAACVYFWKPFIGSMRPWGIFQNTETFSFPSGHTTLSTAVFMGFALLFARAFHPRYRWVIYTFFATIVFAISLSRLYLGAHWFTDIVGAWLLATALLILIALSFNRKTEPRIPSKGIILIVLLAFGVCYSAYYLHAFQQMRLNYSQIDWPRKEVPLALWWDHDNYIPDNQVSLFGFPSQTINLQWVGKLTTIRTTLLKQGWTVPAERDWIDVIHRILDIKSYEYLPLVAPRYLDKKPVLVLTKRVGKRMLALRLWDANRSIQNTHEPLWVGTIQIVPRTYNWLLRRHIRDVELDNEVFTKAPLSFEQKILLNRPAKNKDKSPPVLLLKPLK